MNEENICPIIGDSGKDEYLIKVPEKPKKMVFHLDQMYGGLKSIFFVLNDKRVEIPIEKVFKIIEKLQFLKTDP